MPMLFMECVNGSLKRAGIVAGDSAELGTGTSTATAFQYTASGVFSARSDIQHSVDLMLQMWQEVTSEIYSMNLVPNLLATATITLVTNTREYALPSDFERVAGETYESRVMRSATQAVTLGEYPGGYLKMLADQPVATDWTGQPNAWAISPRDEALRIDRSPTSDENGTVYNLAYERRVELTSTMATATMPYSDTVCRSLIPVVAELYNSAKKDKFDAGVFRSSLVRAFNFANKGQDRTRWGVRRGY